MSRNFYWVPTMLTSFDWSKTDYTHTPALRHEDMTALANLPQATIQSRAEIETTARKRDPAYLKNTSAALAFQVHAAVRTAQDDLIAPVFWSDNWIEFTPGESTTLTALLSDGDSSTPKIHVEGWNLAPVTLTPTAAVAAR